MNKNRTLVIAEVGVNHNGNLSTAFKLITAAKSSGADIVKFQTFVTHDLVSKSFRIRKNQKNISLYKMLKKLELNLTMHKKIIKFAKSKKIEFLSSPFDIKSIKLLNHLGLKKIKIPSGEITNLPYLKYLGKLKKTIILSSGMSNLIEIKTALKILTKQGTKKTNIVVLHCNTNYPTKMSDVNLNSMITIKKKLGIKIGYSDHTEGIEIPIAAVALGARVIEKHLTLDKNSKGPDHKSSIEPDEFKKMVISIRNIEKALGKSRKQITKSELKNIKIARKSLFANKDIKKGENFTNDNIIIKRPGYGISPMKIDKIIGKKAKKNFKKDEMISI